MKTETITLTPTDIERCMTQAKAYNRETLAAFGVEWPPLAGWKRNLIGRTISREQYQRALDGRTISADGQRNMLF